MRLACKNLMLDLKAPPSKSAYHRELIVNFVLGARGAYLDIKKDDNDDVIATKRCLAALSAASDTGDDDITLPANESGSTLRFMIPLALALKGSPERKMIFTTKGRLVERPVDDLAECLAPFGVTIEKDVEKRTVSAAGFLMAGDYTIDGSVSSQYISGLLMALSNFNRPSTITVTGEMSSIHYIELTVAVLKKYGVEITRDENVFNVPGRSGVDAPSGNFTVEGDWSNGAFLLCLGSLMKNGGAMITGLDPESVQGDRAIVDFLEGLGVEVDTEDGAVSVMGPDGEPPVDEITMSCNDIPDIVPYMAVTGAFKAKKTVLTGIKRLRVKESDRASAICGMLGSCGIKTELEEDSLTVYGAVKSDIPEEICLTSSNDSREWNEDLMSMDSTYQGKKLSLMIYGQSHSETIGVYIKGLPEGVKPDEEFIRGFMARRAPGKNAWSTPRKEADEVHFDSKEGMLHGFIYNTNTKPKDYASIMNCPRPSHADYTAGILYGEEASASGGGIFSGRMTAPLCIAGAICLTELKKMGIEIHAHLKSVFDVDDDSYFDHAPRDSKFLADLAACSKKDFPAISDEAAEKMKSRIEEARMDRDSVGGVIECVISGLPAGIGGPIFDGIEGKISQIIFAIPAVKAIEFGAGYDSTVLKGSENNDAFFFDDEEKVRLKTNRCGGILGGISVGEAAPVVFDCALKPTPSISKTQETVDLKAKKNTTISIEGRHDPCVAPRAVPVVEAAAAIALYDMILSRS